MVVKIDVLINEEASLLIGLEFNSINTLCFENRKEIFSQSIVIRITVLTLMALCGMIELA